MRCWDCGRKHGDVETDFSLEITDQDDVPVLEVSIIVDALTDKYDLCHRCLKKVLNGWLRRIIKKEGL